jgi:arsenical pump membrane protein
LLDVTRHFTQSLAAWPPMLALLAVGATTAAASNVMNNLPSALIAGASVAPLHGHNALRAAIAIGIDLGPNLSVTGSLATVLWLIALRREHIDVTPWTFLRAGALVMPPALALAVLSILLTTHEAITVPAL